MSEQGRYYTKKKKLVMEEKTLYDSSHVEYLTQSNLQIQRVSDNCQGLGERRCGCCYTVRINFQLCKMNTFQRSPTQWQIDGERVEIVRDFIFWASKSLQMITAAMKLKDAFSLQEKL